MHDRRPAPRAVRGLFAALAGIVLGLATAACAGRAEDSAPATDRSSRPTSGGVLRLLQEAPSTLDPMLAGSVYEALPINQIFDALVAIDPGLHVVPGLADTWTISKDGLTYTFHVRPGVRFHDGTALTSEDVAYSIRRVLDPRSRGKSIAFSYLLVIDGATEFSEGRSAELPGVATPDAQTVTVRLVRPYLSFLEVMAMDGVRVIPRRLVESIGEQAFGRAPVGTGPFRFDRWDPDKLRLTANTSYFGGAPHLDAVEIHFRRDDEADGGRARFESGEIDLFDVVTDDLPKVTRDPRIHVCRYQELTLSFVGLLTGVPPLDDVRVRRAFAHALDRDALVRQSELRSGAVGILPPGMPSYSPSVKALAYDPAESRRLLAEAGHPGGRGLERIRLYVTGAGPRSKLLMDKIVSDLSAVGIPADVVRVTWAELSRRTEEHTAPAFLLAWIADLQDPDAFLRTLFKSGGSANYFDFLDPESDRLLEAGARETNPVERARIYREAERRILEMAPLVPLYHTVAVIAVRSGVHGLEPGPLGIANVNIEKVWIERGGAGA